MIKLSINVAALNKSVLGTCESAHLRTKLR